MKQVHKKFWNGEKPLKYSIILKRGQNHWYTHFIYTASRIFNELVVHFDFLLIILIHENALD